MMLPAILEGFSPRKDQSYSLRFSTQELHEHQLLALHRCIHQFGLFYFRTGDKMPAGLKKELEETEMDLYDAKKRPSQRLRSVLFLNWRQEGEVGQFAEYYQRHMEKIIDHYKGKIDG